MASLHGRSGSHASAILSRPELENLGRSSTGHLRTLSKFAKNAPNEDFTITSPTQEVTGLAGRRRLQRSDSVRTGSAVAPNGRPGGFSWDRTWMDAQRQFLQAYEYLCHIGEAKEWIEEVIQRPIPPIIELEEALRDGVTLAEIVQTLQPHKRTRIFRHPRLQYRHSDNIAIFFQYLADVELPELFRFELVDLYEKKNIPKVIYCIHALSWLLLRKGITTFRIGNLVGQLQFEHHELEAMQKGLDKAGVSMPSFSGIGANFGPEPALDPEPEPIETEEERIDRELGENHDAIVDFQAQIRGALLRQKLGYMMQELWDCEIMLIDLQSRIRGDWARQISSYRQSMRQFAIQLQSAARGYLARRRQLGKENALVDSEPQITQLQSLIRAKVVRAQFQSLQIRAQAEENGIKKFQAAVKGALQRRHVAQQLSQTQKSEHYVPLLQAAIRGALQRQKLQADLNDARAAAAQVALLQAAARGMIVRHRNQAEMAALLRTQEGIVIFQAAARGALQRSHLSQKMGQIKRSDQSLNDLQATARGAIVRNDLHTVKTKLAQAESSISYLQAALRGANARRAVKEKLQTLDNFLDIHTSIQSAIRGNALRKDLQTLREGLYAEEDRVAVLQASIRGRTLRQEVFELKDAMKQEEPAITELQARIRGLLFRRSFSSDLGALRKETKAVTDLQGRIRGMLTRRNQLELRTDLHAHTSEIVQLQSLTRAMLVRGNVESILSRLEAEDDVITELQAAARGVIVRRRFLEKQQYYRKNMEKVIKVQSFVRGRLQGEAYKSLTNGKNPPVGTVKGFVHLLNDSDFDFDEEIECERLRKSVVQHVRQNEMLEQYIDQLDIKIALLVKNKITLDEVVRHQKHFGGSLTALMNKDLVSQDPSDLKALNKNSRKKLEHYQQLFFILQTRSRYLARLFKRIREQGLAEKEAKRIENLMMSLFGYAQKRREEYYLVKLLVRSMREEVSDCETLQDYLRGNFFWSKLLGSYIRSARDRKYLRDLLGPMIRESIIDNEELDLESDPMQIYKAAINNEELRTGRRSPRKSSISREEAIRDSETRETFIRHLQDLRDIVDQFLTALEDQLSKMPYGLRFIAQQIFEALSARFPHESPPHILQITGHWIWKIYLQPALTQPEAWGVVDRGLTPLQKRNLSEVGKVLSQIAVGRLFGGENVYLQPLNTFIGEAVDRLGHIWEELISVPMPESHYDIDEYNDLYAKTKPTLYIKMVDVFAIHQLVASEVSHLCPTNDDVLREVIRELGSPKHNENEMMTVGSTEINLTLTPKMHDVDDPEAEVNALFTETKRCILYIIRVQSGKSLMEIMVKPITREDEEKWYALLNEEETANGRKRGAYSEANTLLDLTSMSYSELKRIALENIIKLEHLGRLTRHNQYQDLLNAIASDIRTKHRRRVQRQRELEGIKLTLANLREKAVWLDVQLQSYNSYIEQAMMTLQNKKGKKRFLLPFTKQYNHERELQRSGRVPKFGSFKYSARSLYDRGVLVSWKGYQERQWDKVNLTISSDQVGIFSLEGSAGHIQIPGASAEFPLEDLLQAQFDNHQFMTLFEGNLRLNVNLFLHLIFKKFYRDE
ncbi:putative ras GTPase activating protein [Xylona heveae TC161]|uniref:Putative ras GTPase activating protein n=1 Tax=Xylona heveae (strain CBS 132557 / TC161) TaxID=1328760 RepID=A0A165I5Z3_XYLHT|nr:putative ras GTPase activating protein [Xylona heveae TC161]KZF24433.1 putative ras GTPase activating protein [Xylona heveae TC161]